MSIWLNIALNFARVRVIWPIGNESAFHFAYVFVNLAYLALVYVSILPIGLEIALNFACVRVNLADRARDCLSFCLRWC